jgi:hypothetical protein
MLHAFGFGTVGVRAGRMLQKVRDGDAGVGRPWSSGASARAG